MRKNYEIGTIVVFKRDNQVYIGGFDGYYKEGTKNFVRLKSVFYKIYSGHLFYNDHSWRIFPSVINEQLRKATEEEINCYFELLDKEKGSGDSESKLICSLSFGVDKGKPIEDDVNKIFSLTLKEVNGEPYIFLHSKDKNGLSSYSLNDFVTAININSVVKHLKLKINE